MKKVAIYTTPTCTYCKHTKEFFAQHGITYEEHNVATDLEKRREMIDKSGQMGVPVITIDNDVIVGYDPEGLSRSLGI
jgi:glutaredoxin-like YruB-family protein